MASNKEVESDFLPILRVYKDGTVERLFSTPYAPPSLEDPTTGVSSKDVTISSHVSARLYLPNLAPEDTNQKLPILVFFHGGAFCVGSVSSAPGHRSINALVSEAKSFAVSIDYRLAPEHPLPAAYEDCWAALEWVASHSVINCSTSTEPWLIKHGDFDRVYIGGDSAGANIVHNVAMRAGVERFIGDMKILGGFLAYPYFWGSNPIGSELAETHKESLLYRFWLLSYPSAPGGIDNPMINPWVEGAPNLSNLGCSRLLVCVAEKDKLRDRGIRYCETVRKSGWKDELALFEVEGEDHCFHIFKPETQNAKNLIKRLASFITQH